jgi:ABC-type glutathione transport system ATPase component
VLEQGKTKGRRRKLPGDNPVPGAPLLEIRDLHVEFRTRDGIARAVRGASYTVDEGETLAVLGESGSGKSVTAQALMGILDSPPGFVTGGEVLYRGQDILTWSEGERRQFRGE